MTNAEKKDISKMLLVVMMFVEANKLLKILMEYVL